VSAPDLRTERPPHDLAALDALADDLAGMGVPFERSQMFGCPGLRRPGKGKFFATVLGRDVMFKLEGEAHAEALGLDGSHLFQPMEGRPAMKQWVVVPAAHADRWPEFGAAAEASL
jgi:hypothetical protein